MGRNSDASVTIHMLYCLRNQENKRGEHAVKKEAMIMQTSMDFRGITRYDYTAVKPGLFSRIARFFKALFAVKETSFTLVTPSSS